MTRPRAGRAPELPPPEGAPRLRPPPDHAGGVGSVVAATRAIAGETNLWRGARALLAANQPGGFDCPGCAWPEPEHRSHFEFCENGAKAIASEITDARADAAFFADNSVAALAARSDLWLNEAGRLCEPHVLEPGGSHYRPITWEDAFDTIGRTLRELSSPDRAAFYTSGRTSNEAAFLYQLFARELGTNNLPDCSNMCHESSGYAMQRSIGVGKGTVTLDDFDHCDLILVVGQNPGTNHPRMLSTLERAARRGASIVSINPLREAGLVRFKHPQRPWELRGTVLAAEHVQVKINGDVALLNGVTKALLELHATEGRGLDLAFIEAHTAGFDALAVALQGLSWEAIEESSGVGRDAIEALAARCAASRATIACWAMGLTQHRNAVGNIQSLMNLLLLGGHMGRPGAGACPVRGHSNVQGDRTMGINERPPADFLDAIERRFGFSPPREHGLDTVETIRAMRDGRVSVFMSMGGNFLSAAPDTHATADAMRACELTVHVSTKLHRGHLLGGARTIILPCLARSERDVRAAGPQFVTVEDSMSVVHASQGDLAPAHPSLRSEVEIVCRLAQATLGARSRVAWDAYLDDHRAIRRDIAAVVPGFHDFEARLVGSGFRLDNPAARRVFETETGRANFAFHPIPEPEARTGELLLMTIRSHDQYNTTVYGNDDRYRGILGGRRVVLMHPSDMAARGIAAGGEVDVTSRFRDAHRTVEGFFAAPFDIPLGCCAMYFPEANPLVHLDATAEGSNTPASKSVAVTVVPAQAPGSAEPK